MKSRPTQNLNRAALARAAGIGLALLTGSFGHSVAAQATPPSDAGRKVEAKKPDYSPYPDQNFPNRVYWGVAHVHTGFSFDSGMFGVTTTPDDLFRVATGGEVVLTTASASNRTGRSTGSRSPTTPSIWAFPIRSAPAALTSWPTRRANGGTRCPRRALRRE